MCYSSSLWGQSTHATIINTRMETVTVILVIQHALLAMGLTPQAVMIAQRSITATHPIFALFATIVARDALMEDPNHAQNANIHLVTNHTHTNPPLIIIASPMSAHKINSIMEEIANNAAMGVKRALLQVVISAWGA